MLDKAARFTILIDADRKKAFDALCAACGVTTSEMIRRLIEGHLERHDAQEQGGPAPVARIRLASVPSMENKSARLTVLIDPAKKQAFEALCHSQDITPSQVMRRLIREFMEQNAPVRTAASAPKPAARQRS